MSHLLLGGLAGIVVAVIGARASRMSSAAEDRLGRRVSIIRLPLGAFAPDLRFGVLHIHDGDQEQGGLINRVYWFERTEEGELVARVRARKSQGFEYKCFVDHPGRSFPDVRSLLRAAGMTNVTRGLGDAPDRTWFLIPGEKKLRTRGGNVNNFRYRL